MDLPKEKERIKTEIDTIQDEETLTAIKNFLDVTLQDKNFFKTFTVEELQQRALASEQAIREGRVTDIKDPEKESNSW